MLRIWKLAPGALVPVDDNLVLAFVLPEEGRNQLSRRRARYVRRRGNLPAGTNRELAAWLRPQRSGVNPGEPTGTESKKCHVGRRHARRDPKQARYKSHYLTIGDGIRPVNWSICECVFGRVTPSPRRSGVTGETLAQATAEPQTSIPRR